MFHKRSKSISINYHLRNRATYAFERNLVIAYALFWMTIAVVVGFA